jgi:TPP-dependent pyruvate/acetoin dehydrogenase alpha subunit
MTMTAAMGTLDDRKLKRLYSVMLHCRMMSERAQQLRGRSRFASLYDCSPGREAILAGSLGHLSPEDCVVSSHRDIVCHFVKGAPLQLVFEQLRRRSRPLHNTNTTRKPGAHFAQFSGNVIAPILVPDSSAPINMGTGMALAFKLQKRPLVTMAFSADDMYAQAPWHESLRFAALHKLPVIHILHYRAMTAEGKTKPAVEDLAATALSYEMPPITVDASDAVAIYRVTFEAIRRAREGHGPTLIVCQPCRWDESGASSKRRMNSTPHDPLLFMEYYLRQKKLWSDEWRETQAKNFRRELDVAVRRGK